MTEEPEMPGEDTPLGRAIVALRQPVDLGAGPVERAMAIVARPPVRRHFALWVGAGLAAALALLVSRPARDSRDGALDGQAVRFVLQAPASRVSLIGDFNDWDHEATPLHEAAGTWSTTVALRPGRYRYAFLIDGKRVEADPAAPAAADEFGDATSAITIGR